MKGSLWAIPVLRKRFGMKAGFNFSFIKICIIVRNCLEIYILRKNVVVDLLVWRIGVAIFCVVRLNFILIKKRFPCFWPKYINRFRLGFNIFYCIFDFCDIKKIFSANKNKFFQETVSEISSFWMPLFYAELPSKWARCHQSIIWKILSDYFIKNRWIFKNLFLTLFKKSTMLNSRWTKYDLKLRFNFWIWILFFNWSFFNFK